MDRKPNRNGVPRPNAPQTPGTRKPSPTRPVNPAGNMGAPRPIRKSPPSLTPKNTTPMTETPRTTGFAEKAKSALHTFGLQVFYSRDRILCGVVCTILMAFFALLQTTVFSAVRPFGAIPDLMLSFVIALAVAEGERWGAIYGIVAAVVIESLGLSDVTLLPLLYMPVGFFCGVLCRYYFTGSAAVRCVMTVAVLPLRAIFTAVYILLSSMSITVREATLEIILPELIATVSLAIPVHLLVHICLKPFHRTRADKVSEK